MNDRNTIVKEIAGRSKIVLLPLNGIEKSGKNQRLLPLAETLRIAPQKDWISVKKESFARDFSFLTGLAAALCPVA